MTRLLSGEARGSQGRPCRPTGHPVNLRADAARGESCARKHRVTCDEPGLAGRDGGRDSGCGRCGGQPVAGVGAVHRAVPACVPLVRRRGGAVGRGCDRGSRAGRPGGGGGGPALVRRPALAAGAAGHGGRLRPAGGRRIAGGGHGPAPRRGPRPGQYRHPRGRRVHPGLRAVPDRLGHPVPHGVPAGGSGGPHLRGGTGPPARRSDPARRLPPARRGGAIHYLAVLAITVSDALAVAARTSGQAPQLVALLVQMAGLALLAWAPWTGGPARAGQAGPPGPVGRPGRARWQDRLRRCAPDAGTAVRPSPAVPSVATAAAAAAAATAALVIVGWALAGESLDRPVVAIVAGTMLL